MMSQLKWSWTLVPSLTFSFKPRIIKFVLVKTSNFSRQQDINLLIVQTLNYWFLVNLRPPLPSRTATISSQSMLCKEVMVLCLGYKTAIDLGILDHHIHHVTDILPVHEQLSHHHPSLYIGIGKLEGVEVKLHIHFAVPPVTRKARRIPFHLRKKVEKELNHLEQHGTLKRLKVQWHGCPCLWWLPKKNGDVHICIDIQMANKAINLWTLSYTNHRWPDPYLKWCNSVLQVESPGRIPTTRLGPWESLHYHLCHPQRAPLIHSVKLWYKFC